MNWKRIRLQGTVRARPVKHRTRRLLIMAVSMFMLCIAFVFGTIRVYSMPETVEKEQILVNYQQTGRFDYTAYVNSNSIFGEAPASPEISASRSLYFPGIINNVTVNYSYAFLPDDPTATVSANAEIVAIITGPGRWQKEMPVKIATAQREKFAITFPLDFARYDDAVKTVEEELGFRRPSQDPPGNYDLTFVARVTVKGNSQYEKISDTFVQPMGLKVSRGALEWDKVLNLTERRSVGGLSYKHQGSFSYIFNLKQNSLYPQNVIESEQFIPPQSIAVPPQDITFVHLTDVIKANFSYEFRSDKPVRNLSEEVTISTVVESPKFWKKTLVLVPKTKEEGDFKVDFSVDPRSVIDLVDDIKGQIGLAPQSYPLSIRAEVMTTADTDYGRINETFIQEWRGELSGSTIIWTPELKSLRNGTITKKRAVINADKFLGVSLDQARFWMPSLSLVPFMVSIMLGTAYITRRTVSLPPAEKEWRYARKKYRGLIADVEGLLDFKDTVTVPVGSLQDLTSIAQGVLKPVLHEVEKDVGVHTYSVIDGVTRYVYISK